MENSFTDIFEKLEDYEENIEVPKKAPAIREVWKQVSPDTFACKVTGRQLSKVQFRIYQDRSKDGPMGFIVEKY